MALQDLTPQLRTRLRRVEKIVGVFVVLAALLLVAGFAYYLYHTAARKGWFIPQCRYYTFVMSGEGLKLGDPVTLMGFTVGEITVIEAQPPGSYYKVFVGFDIKQPYYGYIWSDSKVVISPTGLLGGRGLEVTAGVAGAPTVYEKDGRIADVLVSGRRISLAEAKRVFVPPEESPSMTERAQKLLGQVEAALPNLLAITNRVNAALDHTNELLTNGTALVARLDRTVAGLPPIISNATVITANLRDPHGSLGEWAVPVDLHTNLNASLITLAAGVNDTLQNLADITSNLNSQVQSNDQILANISHLVVDTDNLVQGLKRHWLLRGLFAHTNAPPARRP